MVFNTCLHYCIPWCARILCLSADRSAPFIFLAFYPEDRASTGVYLRRVAMDPSYYRKLTFVVFRIPVLLNFCRELRARDPRIVTIIPYSGIVEIADHRRHITLFLMRTSRCCTHTKTPKKLSWLVNSCTYFTCT